MDARLVGSQEHASAGRRRRTDLDFFRRPGTACLFGKFRRRNRLAQHWAFKCEANTSNI